MRVSRAADASGVAEAIAWERLEGEDMSVVVAASVAVAAVGIVVEECSMVARCSSVTVGEDAALGVALKVSEVAVLLEVTRPLEEGTNTSTPSIPRSLVSKTLHE